ncbi:hypothetical protein ACJJTC_017351 [Scirpophaga incertulas]
MRRVVNYSKSTIRGSGESGSRIRDRVVVTKRSPLPHTTTVYCYRLEARVLSLGLTGGSNLSYLCDDRWQPYENKERGSGGSGNGGERKLEPFAFCLSKVLATIRLVRKKWILAMSHCRYLPERGALIIHVSRLSGTDVNGLDSDVKRERWNKNGGLFNLL